MLSIPAAPHLLLVSYRSLRFPLSNTKHTMTKTAQDLEKGDKVSWEWGSGQPSGTVEGVVEGDAAVTTNKGNKVTRKGGESS